ncbi:chitobiase/beta-hexosaminidase C-terminal domain-containing protein, partial [Escherichia coli]|nr:chitobiase/beta-hexosaminidase C-terminal domain-containing protein [Escherichia coli]
MMLPRLAAACEVQWSSEQEKDYGSFLQRLPHMLQLYTACGYRYAEHYFTVSTVLTPSPKVQAMEVALSAPGKAKIYYTTDGSEPNEQSRPYKKSFCLKQSATIKAIAYSDSLHSDVTKEQVIVHKTMMKP